MRYLLYGKIFTSACKNVVTTRVFVYRYRFLSSDFFLRNASILICFLNIRLWFRANSHTIPLSSRRRRVTSCCSNAKEPWKRDRIFAVEKMTKIRYCFGRHPVRRYFRRAHTFIEKSLNGRVCGRSPRVGAIIYAYWTRVCPEHTSRSESHECVLCLFNARRERNVSIFVACDIRVGHSHSLESGKWMAAR